MPAVGDERLRAVDDVVLAVAAGGGLDALQVGAGAGFGHRDGADQLAARHARQPVALLLLAAVGEDVVGHDALDAGAEVDAGASQFLQDHGLVGEGAAAAAVFLGHVGQQQVQRARGVQASASGRCCSRQRAWCGANSRWMN